MAPANDGALTFGWSDPKQREAGPKLRLLEKPECWPLSQFFRSRTGYNGTTLDVKGAGFGGCTLNDARETRFRRHDWCWPSLTLETRVPSNHPLRAYQDTWLEPAALRRAQCPRDLDRPRGRQCGPSATECLQKRRGLVLTVFIANDCPVLGASVNEAFCEQLDNYNLLFRLSFWG